MFRLVQCGLIKDSMIIIIHNSTDMLRLVQCGLITDSMIIIIHNSTDVSFGSVWINYGFYDNYYT